MPKVSPEVARLNWQKKAKQKMDSTIKSIRSLKAFGRGRYKPTPGERYSVGSSLTSEVDALIEAWTPGDPAPDNADFTFSDE